MAVVRVCVACRAGGLDPAAAFCARCGQPLVEVAIDGGAAPAFAAASTSPTAPATPPVPQPLAPAWQVAAATAGGPSLAMPAVAAPSMAAMSARIAALPESITYPVAAWVGMTVVAVVAASPWLGGASLGSLGVVGSLAAGLGLSASAQASVVGIGGGGSLSVSGAWLVGAAALAGAAFAGSRRVTRVADPGLGGTLIAAGAATAVITVAASILLAALGFPMVDGLNTLSDSYGNGLAAVSVSVSPVFASIIVVLFPTLAIGTVGGRAWVVRRLPSNAFARAAARGGLAGLAGYAATIGAATMVIAAFGLVSGIWSFVAGHGQPAVALAVLGAPNIAAVGFVEVHANAGILGMPLLPVAWLFAFAIPGLAISRTMSRHDPIEAMASALAGAGVVTVVATWLGFVAMPQIDGGVDGLATYLGVNTSWIDDLHVDLLRGFPLLLVTPLVAAFAGYLLMADALAPARSQAAAGARSAGGQVRTLGGRARAEGPRGLTVLARAWLASRSRVQQAALAGMAGVVLLGAVGVYLVNQPDARLRGGLEAIANRQEATQIANWRMLGQDVGIASAPADVAISVRDVALAASAGDGWTATWTEEARRGDKVIASHQLTAGVTDGEDGLGVYLDANVRGFSLVELLPALTDEASARTLVEQTNTANALFGLSAELVDDVTERWLDVVEEPDPTIFADDACIPTEGMPEVTHLLRWQVAYESAVVVETGVTKGVAPVCAVGTLPTRATLEDDLQVTYDRLRTLAAAGDLDGASTLLSGLTDGGINAPAIADAYRRADMVTVDYGPTPGSLVGSIDWGTHEATWTGDAGWTIQWNGEHSRILSAGEVETDTGLFVVADDVVAVPGDDGQVTLNFHLEARDGFVARFSPTTDTTETGPWEIWLDSIDLDGSTIEPGELLTGDPKLFTVGSPLGYGYWALDVPVAGVPASIRLNLDYRGLPPDATSADDVEHHLATLTWQ
jgi:hypothetical protein